MALLGAMMTERDAVTDGATAYELRYDPEQMGWRLASSESCGKGTTDEHG